MVGPILRALSRRGTTAALVVLEVAFGMSVAVEAMVFSRFFERVTSEDSRLDPGVFAVTSELGAPDASPARLAELRARDLEALQAIPGVAAAMPIQTLPRSRSIWSNVVELDGRERLAYFFEGVGLLRTIGVPIAAGRDLVPADVGAPGPTAIVISPPLAAALGGDVVGKTVRLRGRSQPAKIVGVSAEMHLVTSLAVDAENLLLIADPPPLARTARYLVRPVDGAADAVVARVAPALHAVEPRRVVSHGSLAELRERVERSAVGGRVIFSVIVLAVVFTVLLGSLGMASFLVAERVKQIGTRRALGATRGAIVKHFLVENWLTTSAGLLLGLPLTFALAEFARTLQPELRVEWHALVVAALVFWITGLCAALVPALRAAAVPPTTATRTI